MDGRIAGVNWGPYGGICFLLKHLFLFHLHLSVCKFVTFGLHKTVSLVARYVTHLCTEFELCVAFSSVTTCCGTEGRAK